MERGRKPDVNDIKCPSCAAALPANQLESGWCDQCGKKIPHFVYTEAGSKAPEERRLTKVDGVQTPMAAEEMEDLPTWKIALLAAAVLAVAAVIVYEMVK